MNISYEQVRTFVAVVETGSFSAAARHLNKHRTTLGQVISNLEIETNMTLFDRNGKFPVLTEHGHALFRHAKSLNDSSIAFENLCMTIESGVESNITIYHSGLVPSEMIASVMMDIRKEYPYVNVHWLHRSTDQTRDSLQTGETDLGIVLLDNNTQGASSTDYVHLMSMPFKVVASPSFFPNSKQKLNARDLGAHRQILLEDYNDISRKIIVSPNIQKIENISIFIALLTLGEGWAVVPAHIVENELKHEKLIELNVEELNTKLRFPLAIWSMNQSQSGPIRSKLIESLCIHARRYEDLTLQM
ncbi:LysR family transcriptional regulator [Vibrio splendidus]|uniref:LysR family transcriptional regulator n=1 Tax=Vibrio splendidus TaxID=29497 RepID=UPI000D39DF42|nr:LysR family transcriptional regulator [Vibrio splendidus]PTP10083.1 LysR family transcriptional regulator [Vibrio splendidus]PTP26520.1 LysR family transcriptional regulator [Vibrio splendidus]PTP68660.1 LysR family transcriptional regulator [Vibrio splendidus]